MNFPILVLSALLFLDTFTEDAVDELSRTVTSSPRVRTNDLSVVSALPFTLKRKSDSSRTPGPRAGL